MDAPRVRARLSWAGGLAAVVAYVVLQRGLQFSTFPDVQVFDLRVDDRTVVGLAARYGLGDRWGDKRPVRDPRLFASTPDVLHSVPSPAEKLVDLAWIPSRRAFVAVSSHSLHEVPVDAASSRLLWRSPGPPIRVGEHGPDGQVMIVLEAFAGRKAMIYVHDVDRNAGEEHEAASTPGNPHFLPGLPVRALVTVGADLWRFTWPERTVEILPGASADGWFEGNSGGQGWFSHSEGWQSGSTQVPNGDLTSWGAAAEGFVTLGHDGRWKVTPPRGDAVREGTIDLRGFKSLRFPQGAPWIVFRSGEARPLEAPAPAFRVRLP